MLLICVALLINTASETSAELSDASSASGALEKVDLGPMPPMEARQSFPLLKSSRLRHRFTFLLPSVSTASQKIRSLPLITRNSAIFSSLRHSKPLKLDTTDETELSLIPLHQTANRNKNRKKSFFNIPKLTVVRVLTKP